MINLINKIPIEILTIIKSIGQTADYLNLQAFIVGGIVRDLILDRPCKDIDIVCVGSGIELAKESAKKIPNATAVAFFKNFGTAQFKVNDFDFEFVGARKESYRKDSRKPVVEDGTIKDDQNRRDFTINAMAIAINSTNFGELVDPFDGVSDLKKRTIKTPLDPDITFSDDPLRMMRAIRFATQLQFTIDEKSYASIRKNADRIKIISFERISTELNKIIESEKPSIGLKLLYNTGLLHHFFPELAKLQFVKEKNGITHKDNFYHTLEVLDNLSKNTDNLWLRWSAILHDIAKPQTQRFEKAHGWTFHGHEVVGARVVPRVFKRLRLPLDNKMKYVQKLVNLHLRPISLTKENITDSAVRRLLFDTGDDIDDLMLLAQADITSKNEKKVKRYLSNYEILKVRLAEVEETDRIRNWQPPISGDLIIETFNIKPSKEVGIIKNAIREAILDGIIPNEYEPAFDFMLKEGEKLGLTTN